LRAPDREGEGEGNGRERKTARGGLEVRIKSIT